MYSNDDPGLTMTFFYGKVKFGHFGFPMGKSENNAFSRNCLQPVMSVLVEAFNKISK